VNIEEIIERVVRRVVREEVKAALVEQRNDAQSSEWVCVRSCGIPPTTRKRLTKNGTLPVAKIGRDLHVKRSDVAKYFSSQMLATADGEAGDEFTRALRGRVRSA
jgi:hypothetical protein